MLAENYTIKISDQDWTFCANRLSEMKYFSALIRSSFKDSQAAVYVLDETILDREGIRNTFHFLDKGTLACTQDSNLSKTQHHGADLNPHWRLLGKVYAVAQFLCYDKLLDQLRQKVMLYLDHVEGCKGKPCKNMEHIPKLYMAFHDQDEVIQEKCWILLKKWWYLVLGQGWPILSQSIRRRLFDAISKSMEDSNAFQLLEEWTAWKKFISNPKAARYRNELQKWTEEMKEKFDHCIGMHSEQIFEKDRRLFTRITSPSWCQTDALQYFLETIREVGLPLDCVPITFTAYKMLSTCQSSVGDESSEHFVLLNDHFRHCLQYTTKRWFNIADRLFQLPQFLLDAIVADQKITQEELRTRAQILRNSRKIVKPIFPINK
jgi:hypothetical protein